jgi:hypothetical protein
VTITELTFRTYPAGVAASLPVGHWFAGLRNMPAARTAGHLEALGVCLLRPETFRSGTLTEPWGDHPRHALVVVSDHEPGGFVAVSDQEEFPES